MTRSLVTIFNEKALCGLGREVQTTGLLAPDAVAKALTSLRRFRALCRVMKVGRVHAIATAACRDATNGPDFFAKAERICGVSIEILSGPREAKLSALGVISGIHNPDGIVGDLGGGSLELIDVRGNRVHSGVTLPLGSLALQDAAHQSLKRAERIVKTDLAGVAHLKAGRGRTFYAVGGTWRARTRSISPSGCAGLHRRTCWPISKSSPTHDGRCWPMPRWFSNTSFAWRSRRPSYFRPSGCAKA